MIIFLRRLSVKFIYYKLRLFTQSLKQLAQSFIKQIRTSLFCASPHEIKVVLPRYQTKKGSALTYEEEAKLVRYCRENADNAATDAILALLYFGMRQSELATMRVIDDKWLEIETSKERLGQDVVLRRAPFTPMVQKVLPLIDFEKVRTANTRTIASTIKRVLPDHHVHELRHTYVSRCKECGVAGEVVSIWAGAFPDGYDHFHRLHTIPRSFN